MTESGKSHWEGVYTTKAADAVSWFQTTPAQSLHALDALGAEPGQSLIDMGGGASTLVDALLERGWSDVSVLDISEAALAESKHRLGSQADAVNWIAADITEWAPKRRFEIWHDRAVFHFLTDPRDREAYRERLHQALAPKGAVIIATFAQHGPERCSGLPVQRYDSESLAAELGPEFEMLRDWTEDHVTPAGNRQAFTWCVFKRL
jgi:2-polyprenyl-3-methyl-5-hydroxy-6-metoxy-1,4-benzoquinol methylase